MLTDLTYFERDEIFVDYQNLLFVYPTELYLGKEKKKNGFFVKVYIRDNDDVFDETKDKGERVIIGSDTIVVKDGKIYGKPKNHDDALEMLRELKNAKHEVMTGICIISEKEGIIKEFIDADVTNVYIKDISDEELENWIATNEAYDKAGGYAIQGKFGVFVDKIEGNYFTVVGLPVHKVYDALKNI